MKQSVFLIACLLMVGCGATRQRMTISDYIILPNGKEVLGTKPLSAFIFESNQKDVPFQKFLMAKYDLNNIRQKDIWITIDGDKFELLVYDNSELEKYFTVSNFIVTNQIPETMDVDNPKFIAISMISSTNEDCLSEKSLYQNIAIKYLRDLKEAYYKH